MPALNDTYSKYGAGVLAATIEKFWHDRGFLQVKAERYEFLPDTWGVRSNLVAGRAPQVGAA